MPFQVDDRPWELEVTERAGPIDWRTVESIGGSVWAAA
jgi:hypothetical protein